MTINARTGVAVLTLGAALTLAGCTDREAPPATSTSSAATSATAPSTATSAAADPQLAGAESVVEKFWSVVDALGKDSKRSLDELTTVSRGQTLETWRELLTNQRRLAYQQLGSISVLSSKASSSGGTLHVAACIDVSKTSLVDKDGKSLVAADRPPRVRYEYVVEKGSDGKFYVMQDKAVGKC